MRKYYKKPAQVLPKRCLGFDQKLPRFEAKGAQVLIERGSSIYITVRNSVFAINYF